MQIIEGDNGINRIDFSVELEEMVGADVTIDYKTHDASAFQDLDFVKQSGQITIPSGSTQGIIQLEIVADLIKEGNEEFKLLFEAESNVEFNTQAVLIRIQNDDSQLPYDEEDYTTPTSYQGWDKVWADEFTAGEINSEWWTHEIGNGEGGWGNNELQYYTDGSQNSRIRDGKLVIEARDDSWNGQKYTSARMITKNKQTFGFSRVDIRAKVPYGQGIWPALWMLGESFDDKGWPACGEIDIMELVGHQPSTSHATVHWGSSFPSHKYIGSSYQLTGEKFNDRFHVFTVVREFNVMYFYVDDILIYEYTSADSQGQPYPFNDQFFFLFNVAIGGKWPGNPDETTPFPQRMEVDYVRVFKKSF